MEKNKPLLVQDIMTKHIYSLEQTATVADAVSLMAGKRISTIVIYDKGTPAGIVTERDLVFRIMLTHKSQETVLSEVMSPSLISIEPDATVLDAGKLMEKTRVRKLLVKEKNNLVGIISVTDIMRNLSKII